MIKSPSFDSEQFLAQVQLAALVGRMAHQVGLSTRQVTEASRWPPAMILEDYCGLIAMVQAAVATEDAYRAVGMRGMFWEPSHPPFGIRVVDIYVSVGDPKNEDCKPSIGDEKVHHQGCGIYRLRMQLSAMNGVATLMHVERVVSPSTLEGRSAGAVQAAISPDGTRIAYVLKSDKVSQLHVMSTNGTGSGNCLMSAKGDDRPQFPNWALNGVLLYHNGPESEHTLRMMTVTGEPGQKGSDVGLFGPERDRRYESFAC